MATSLYPVLVFGVLAVLFSGCDSRQPPANPQNLCSIFQEKPGWYKKARKAQARWGTPIATMMAIMYQESGFRYDARPPRRWFLFIPLPRRSSACGYAQIQDGAWADYCREAAGWFASRKNFGDAIDFIGWYNHKSKKINGISQGQADLLYLNYHEGWRGFRLGRWKSRAWLRQAAEQVRIRSARYQQQLDQCLLGY